MIQVEHLSKRYPDGVGVCALDDVSFVIEQNEFLALAGPSGSGKSTLLHILGALDQPTSGSVRMDGKEITSLRGSDLAIFHREKVGFVFQAFYLAPALTALENVMLPLLPYQRNCPFDLAERANELLEEVGLSARRTHFPAQLSGGEQQRVAIARALVNHPACLLADEPTGNLDRQMGKEIIAILADLNRRSGVTVLIATHDREVMAQASRILSLSDGRIVAD